MKKPSCVKDLDHSIPLEFACHVVVLWADFSQPDPEDTALAQPLDEDALLVGPDQHTSLQVAQELACDVALAIVLDELGRGEVDALHAVWTVKGTATQGLLGGDSAAFRMINHRVLHQLPSVVETDHHMGESWRGEDLVSFADEEE